MKTLTMLCLILAFPTSIEAGERIDQTLDVSKTAHISIEDPNSRIEIHAWNKNKVKVSGELSKQAKNYRFERQGGNVIFDVEYADKMSWRKKSSGQDISRLKFYVPIESRLAISNVNGDIDVTGVEGGASVESVNGNIAVKKLKQRISLETINGSITVDSVAGKLSIETINGNVNDSGSSGELNVSTVQGKVTVKSRYSSVAVEVVNGNLELQLEKIDELTIESVNGKVDVAMDLNSEGEVSVSNVNGSIDLRFNKDVSADFEIETFVGGTIVNGLTVDKADKQKFGPGSSLQFSKNGGSAQVSVNSVSGTVRIETR